MGFFSRLPNPEFFFEAWAILKRKWKEAIERCQCICEFFNIETFFLWRCLVLKKLTVILTMISRTSLAHIFGALLRLRWRKEKRCTKQILLCAPFIIVTSWNKKISIHLELIRDRNNASNEMIFKVKLSRLLRKRALDVNCISRSSSSTVSQSRTLINAVLRTANSPLAVGYFIVFSYSAQLAPSTLLAAVFVASIASLLSGLSNYSYSIS